MRIRPRRKAYSVATILAVVILTAFTYKGLQASAIFWGKPLGDTDDDIARSMETYATRTLLFSWCTIFSGTRVSNLVATSVAFFGSTPTFVTRRQRLT